MGYLIEGTLDGPFGPWLARGPEGPVVLRRAQGGLCLTGSAHVADAFARREVEGRPYDVEPYVAGAPLDALHLDDAEKRSVLAQVARGLAALHGRGVGHGAVGGGTVRIETHGAVRLVGARRGSPADDDGALDGLAHLLWDEIPADVVDSLERGNEAWAARQEALLRGIEAQECNVQPHALAGQTISLAGPPGPEANHERPVKVRVALFAGLTLLLGLLAGAMLAGCGEKGPPPLIRVHVPGAIQVSVYCGGVTTHRTQAANADTLEFEREQGESTHCELEAPISPVMPLRGTLELTSAGSYRCDRDGVVLVCHPADGEAP